MPTPGTTAPAPDTTNLPGIGDTIDPSAFAAEAQAPKIPQGGNLADIIQKRMPVSPGGRIYNTPDDVAQHAYDDPVGFASDVVASHINGGIPTVKIGQTIDPKELAAQPPAPVDVAPGEDTSFLAGHPILKTLGYITGLNGLGKGISQAIFLNFTPEGKQTLQMLQDGKITPEEFDSIVGGGIATPNEVLGSSAQTATNLALLGESGPAMQGIRSLFGAGGEAATAAPGMAEAVAKNILPESSSAVPQNWITRALTSAPARKIATSAVKNATIGGILGAEQGVTDNLSPGETLGNALTTGTISGILGSGGTAISQGLRTITAPELMQKLYGMGIGVPKNVAKAGNSPSAFMLNNGFVGTAKGLSEKIGNVIDEVEPQISDMLKGTKTTVKSGELFQKVADNINQFHMNAPEEGVTPEDIKGIISSLLPNTKTLLDKDELTVNEANRLRQIMDKTLGDRAFTATQLPQSKDTLMSVAHAFRGAVKGAVKTAQDAGEVPLSAKGENIMDLYDRYSNAVQAAKILNDEMAKPHAVRHMISIGSSLAGAIPGLMAGGAPGAVAGAMAGVGSELAQSTAGRTGMAVAGNGIHNAMDAMDRSLTANLIKKLGAVGGLNLIKNAGEPGTTIGNTGQ